MFPHSGSHHAVPLFDGHRADANVNPTLLIHRSPIAVVVSGVVLGCRCFAGHDCCLCLVLFSFSLVGVGSLFDSIFRYRHRCRDVEHVCGISTMFVLDAQVHLEDASAGDLFFKRHVKPTHCNAVAHFVVLGGGAWFLGGPPLR